MNEIIKIGHQAPKGLRVNNFNEISIRGDFRYCESHNFLYDGKLEEEKLYNGEPCYYTDKRFYDGSYNFYKECKIHWTRHIPISLKASIRQTLKCGNIPVGTIVNFNKSWYNPRLKIDNSYKFKVKKFNEFNVDYKVDIKTYSDNFTNCERSKILVNTLRKNGFLVRVHKNNPNFISSMISNASELFFNPIDRIYEDGEIAYAYGYGKKIGFSSNLETFRGYSDGCNNILWDDFGYFNKWSQCYEITKDSPITKILKILKNKDERN